jgi:hypothetical protein
MSLDLANTKTRAIKCSAVMGFAPMIARAIANPGVKIEKNLVSDHP